MSNSANTNRQVCHFLHFGLIVTGEGERQHLLKMFKPLEATGKCAFRILRRIEQRSPITSEKRTAHMVGSGQIIPNKDAEEIGFPTRAYLETDECRFVILIDDLEHDRREQARQVFERYRIGFDTLLKPAQRDHAAVHFLVNMLEAYYFADANAINAVLDLNLKDYPGDVETIRHPKGDLKQSYAGFDEVEHGGQILACIDIGHVLSHPKTCASLRTLFAWCVKILAQSPYCDTGSLAEKYQLTDGNMSEITRSQLESA